ncbi:MAG: hypothetical protein FWC89_00125 [Defluviitaleaceae bacterium]|nr:hypothetical protein [Defluviitaleaceae bacterium]
MTTKEIKQKAEQHYAACGIIPAKFFDEYTKFMDERVKTFPKSKKLYAGLYNFAQPPESAKSIIVCIQRLNKYKVPNSLRGLIGKHYLFDGRVHFSEEYRAGAEFEAYLHTLGMSVIKYEPPVRWAAARAGIGKFGRNNFIYSLEHGSNVIVRTWTVDKVLEYDEIPADFHLPECSDDCQKCVKACPTNAFTDGFSMDYAKCIAYHTFNAEELPSEEILQQMGQCLYGCDMCQDVCPANKNKFTENEPFPLLEQYEAYMQPEAVFNMTEETYNKIVNPRFWYCGENGLWRWKCSALRAMVNSKKPEYFKYIKDSLSHEDPRIQTIAQWGCRTLGL